jgi:hypothetical protein
MSFGGVGSNRMSIHFISGKPGGGKSLYGVKLIVEELRYGSRPIYTNVPLLVGRLNEYLQEDDRLVDVVGRVRLLSDDEAQRFFTVRPNGAKIEVLTAAEWSQGRKPRYENITDRGVLYVIDEVHNFFNARAWAETGRDVLFYLSQHRKLGDTVICITQAIGNVDKQFRSVTQDFTYIRNLTKERMGLFKLPAVFVRKTFGAPATDTSKPMETGTFRLDVSGLASCYDTAVGVGIHARGADLGERRKGMHWSLFLVGVPLLLMAIAYAVPRVGAKLFSPDRVVAQVLSTNAAGRGGVGRVVRPSVGVTSGIGEGAAEGRSAAGWREVAAVGAGVAEARAEVFYCGFDRLDGRRVRVWFSDGTYAYVGAGVRLVTPFYCVREDGVTNRLKPPGAGPIATGGGGWSGSVADIPQRERRIRVVSVPSSR